MRTRSGARPAGRGAPRRGGCRCIRSRTRSRLTRPSDRARGAPGHEWLPRPKAMWACALGRSMRNSAGHSNRRGSRLAAPFNSITGVPAATSTPATLVSWRARRKSAFTGLSRRSVSSRKLGMRSRFARSASCTSGCSARCSSVAASRRAVVSCPAANRNVARAHDVEDVGRAAVGVGRAGARLVSTSPRGSCRRSSMYCTKRSSSHPSVSSSMSWSVPAPISPGLAAQAEERRGTARGPLRARRAGRRRRAWRRAACTR